MAERRLQNMHGATLLTSFACYGHFRVPTPWRVPNSVLGLNSKLVARAWSQTWYNILFDEPRGHGAIDVHHFRIVARVFQPDSKVMNSTVAIVAGLPKQSNGVRSNLVNLRDGRCVRRSYGGRDKTKKGNTINKFVQLVSQHCFIVHCVIEHCMDNEKTNFSYTRKNTCSVIQHSTALISGLLG